MRNRYLFMTLSTSYTGRMNEPQADSSTVHLQVAAEVRAHLARQRISGRRAAFALGWKQPYIARRLSGEVPFDVTDLAKLAELLGLPVTSFFDNHVSVYAHSVPSNLTTNLTPDLGLAA